MVVASSEPEATATASVLVGTDLEVVTAERRLLGPASLSLRTGELVAVIGPSGAGKTTLLRALAGVTGLGAGTVTLDSEPIASQARNVGFLPENSTVHDLLTVREALRYTVALRRPDLDSVDSEHINEVIAELNLAERADARFAELSRGEPGLASEPLLVVTTGSVPIRIRLTGTSSTLAESVRRISAIAKTSSGTWRGLQRSRIERACFRRSSSGTSAAPSARTTKSTIQPSVPRGAGRRRARR